MELVKVKNFPSRMFAEQARQILQDEGIPAVILSPDVGITGTTGSRVVQGADLYVPEQFASKARELVTALFDGI